MRRALPHPLSLSLTRTRTNTRARTHAHTHTNTPCLCSPYLVPLRDRSQQTEEADPRLWRRSFACPPPSTSLLVVVVVMVVMVVLLYDVINNIVRCFSVVQFSMVQLSTAAVQCGAI